MTCDTVALQFVTSGYMRTYIAVTCLLGCPASSVSSSLDEFSSESSGSIVSSCDYSEQVGE